MHAKKTTDLQVLLQCQHLPKNKTDKFNTLENCLFFGAESVISCGLGLWQQTKENVDLRTIYVS